MAWPVDWPEDKKTGPGFLAELMRRHPDLVQVVAPLDDAFYAAFEPELALEKPNDVTESQPVE